MQQQIDVLKLFALTNQNETKTILEEAIQKSIKGNDSKATAVLQQQHTFEKTTYLPIRDESPKIWKKVNFKLKI